MVQALFLHTDTLRPIVSLDLDFSALTYTKVKAFPIGLKFPSAQTELRLALDLTFVTTPSEIKFFLAGLDCLSQLASAYHP